MDIPKNQTPDEKPQPKRSRDELRVMNLTLSETFGTTVRIRLLVLRITYRDVLNKENIYQLQTSFFCQPWLQSKQRKKKKTGQCRLIGTAAGMESLEIHDVLASRPQKTPTPPKWGSYWLYLLIAPISCSYSDAHLCKLRYPIFFLMLLPLLLLTGTIEGDEMGILPPINLESSSPLTVVNLDDLVPPHIRELLTSLPDVKKMIERDQAEFQEWKELEAFPKWFLTALQSLPQGEGYASEETLRLVF